ncbi:Type 4 prepilin-like proteins leader peptide-processing enzyme [Hyphomicrobium sp. ghe19]|nr:Type 4 prepilin-like proteins leader peptide-processing enzyme [Hyphomicrobium sp. ghe19]
MVAEILFNQLKPVSLLLAGLLVTLAMIDFTSFRLPNSLNICLGISGLCCASPLSFATLSDRFLGVILGGGILAIAALAYRRLKNAHGLGGGDTKLLAAGGAWVSWQGIPTVLMIGASTAAIYGIVLAVLAGRDPRVERVPFGTFLCLGIWMTWLNGPLAG